MIRGLLHLLTALSLVLCLAVAAVWVRSFRSAMQLDYERKTGGTNGANVDIGMARLGRGNAFLMFVRVKFPEAYRDPSAPVAGRPAVWTVTWDDPDPMNVAAHIKGSRFGFGYESQTSMEMRSREITFPLWLPALALAVAPLVWMLRWHRQRGLGPRSCGTCGYDLRATPGRCPECGTEAAGVAANTAR